MKLNCDEEKNSKNPWLQSEVTYEYISIILQELHDLLVPLLLREIQRSLTEFIR